MKRLGELLEKAKGAVARARAELDAFHKEDKVPPPEVVAKAKAYMTEYQDLKGLMDSIYELDQADKWLNEPVWERKSTVKDKGIRNGDIVVFRKSYDLALRKYLITGEKSAFADVDHEKLSMIYPELKAQFKASPYVEADGGAWIFPEVSTEVIQKLTDMVYIRQRATVRNVGAGEYIRPTFEYEGSMPAVIAAQDDITAVDPTGFSSKLTWKPVTRAVIIKIPITQIEDTQIDLETLFTDHFTLTRFAVIEEADYLAGDGSPLKQPLGILNAGINSITAVGGVGGDAMSAEDVVKVKTGIKLQYRKNAVWILNRTSLELINLMREDTAGAGSGGFLFQPSWIAGQPDRLHGFPVLESEYMTDPTDESFAEGDAFLAFGDWTYYLITDRIGMTVQRLVEKYAEQDKIGIKLRRRYDGGPMINEAFVRLNRGSGE